ncbi:MAG: hypothetical protein JWM10_4313 [Myxococcaceae bacterium]|nr:hypothetical protein [Myxococcaceae bacterium]
MRIGALGLAALWAVGCVSAGGARRHGTRDTLRATAVQERFPSRDDLARLASTPAPARAAAEPVAPLERWELAGPFPPTLSTGDSTAADPFSVMVRQRAAASQGRARSTDAMLCVAREVARHALQHAANPAGPLMAFIAGRCGAPTAFIQLGVSRGDTPARQRDTDVLPQVIPAVARTIDDTVRQLAVPIDLGGAFAREGDHFALVFAMIPRHVDLDPASPVPDARGDVTLQGRLTGPAESASARVNRGRWETAPCTLDPAVRLPLFRLRCPVRPEDPVARIEVLAHAPGRLLGESVLDVVVGAGRDASRVFDVAATDPANVTTDPARSREVLGALVNDARRSAGLEPVTVAARQSDTICGLAGRYLTTDPDGAAGRESVALGLMAGWDVEGGLIQSGDFLSVLGAQDHDYARWLSWTLERPSGRALLLDPTVRQVAVCPTAAPGNAAALLWTSYHLYDDRRLAADVDAVYDRLDRARADAGSGPAQRMLPVQAWLKEESRAIGRGAGLEPVLQAMLNRAQNGTGRPTRGWVVATSDVSTVEFPRTLLRAPRVDVAVEAVRWRPPGAAWAVTLVFVVAQ